MNRIASILMTAVMFGAAVGAVPLTGFAQSAGGAGTDAGATAEDSRLAAAENGTEESVPPGAMLSGVVGVQEAEIGGEIEARAFGIKVARAGSNASKAGVVAGEVRNASERLEELRERKRALERARENGSITDATFRAEMAELGARIETVKRLSDRSAAVADGLPPGLLAENGVNETAIDTLRADAARLAGPEVAEIARSIAGPGVGEPIARGGGTGGPPGNVLHRNDTGGVPGGNGTEGVPGGNETGDGGPPDDLPGGNETADNGTAGESGAGSDSGENGSGGQDGAGGGTDGSSDGDGSGSDGSGSDGSGSDDERSDGAKESGSG